MRYNVEILTVIHFLVVFMVTIGDTYNEIPRREIKIAFGQALRRWPIGHLSLVTFLERNERISSHLPASIKSKCNILDVRFLFELSISVINSRAICTLNAQYLNNEHIK